MTTTTTETTYPCGGCRLSFRSRAGLLDHECTPTRASVALAAAVADAELERRPAVTETTTTPTPTPTYRATVSTETRRDGNLPPHTSLVVTVRDESRGVDRWEHVMAWGLTVSDRSRKLAARLARAVEAGVALTDAEVRTDVRGQTYWEASCHVLGRRMNADLRRLGF